MAVTRIKNNQITDSTIVANAKVVDYSISASKLANNLTYGSNFTVSGNLTVNGTTTTVDTINTLIKDPILVLADGQTSGSPTVDIGILGYRGSENSSFIGWKESDSTFMAILSNTTISNTTVNVTSYANFTASTITTQANLSVIGNVLGNLNATSYVNAGNVTTPGLISATGNITGGNILTGGLISATSTITSAANITGGNILTGGLISATATITGGNLETGGTVSATANITGGNVLTGGLISAGGNITSATNVNTPNVVGATGLTVSTGSGDLVLTPSGNINASSNYINNLADPVLAQDAASKQYVDDSVSSGITIHTPVRVESPTALNGTYAQGGTTATVTDTVAGNTVVFGSAIDPQVNDQYWFTSAFSGILANTPYFVVSAPNTSAAVLSLTYSGAPVANITSATGLTQPVRINSGVGATLTNAGANATLVIDGVTLSNTNRVLVYTQANAVQNGVYVVSEAGNATTAWQLTRSTDTDVYGPKSTTELDAGDYFYVTSGDTGAGESYVMTAPTTPFIIGYDNLTFTQFSASQVYTANTSAGLSLIGTVFNAKVDGVTTAFDGGGNISVKVSANLTTPNIGVANGTSLSVSGNINAGTTVIATGNITGGNVLTGGLVSSTGNITGGNLLTSGSGGAISGSGNITGGNILTGGLISAASTGTFGNISVGTDSINSANGRITVNSGSADTDVAFNADTVANVFYIDAGTGTASFGNSTQTTNAIVAFNSPTSVVMPVGNTAQRPGTGVTGMIRFNTNNNALEIYDNAAWTDVGVPVFTVIADEQFSGDGSTVAFTLSSTQTTNSCIVSINGVVQIPTSAYSVAGTDPSCVLTFTEAPASGDLIDVREITTTTTVTSITNSSGNAVIATSPTANDVNITGDFMPTGNGTQSIGSNTNRFSNIWLTGTTITLGNTTIKNTSGNSIGFFGPDGTTPATIDAASVDTTTIANGTSNVKVVSSNGNVTTNVNGTSNVMVVSSTDVTIAGNLTVTGNATLSGNILGDRIQNGTTQIDIQSTGGNANITVGGTSNVAVFATTGEYVTGLLSVTGNIAGGSAGNIQLGMDTANIHLTNTTGSGNITFLTNFGGSGIVQVFKVLGTGTQGTLTNGNISATGNITGGNLSVGLGTVTVGNIVNSNGNGVGNIGSSSTYFNTAFIKATSAQYADLAEKYTADAEYAPGTVVSFGGTHEVTLSTQDADRRVAGVVSTNPSYIMNGGLEGANIATVALTGRVPTKVTGAVAKGDLMVSNGDGTARAETDPRAGAIIGKALEDFAGDVGVIEVVIGRF